MDEKPKKGLKDRITTILAAAIFIAVVGLMAGNSIYNSYKTSQELLSYETALSRCGETVPPNSTSTDRQICDCVYNNADFEYKIEKLEMRKAQLRYYDVMRKKTNDNGPFVCEVRDLQSDYYRGY